MMERRQGGLQFCLTVLALLASIALPQAAWAAAGKVIFVYGDVHLASGEPLDRGDELDEGDEIVTGEDGRVQLLMADGDRIAIRPNSRLLIEVFQTPDESQSATSAGGIQTQRVYNLLKGGFRTLTNKGGGRDESEYQVKTPVATIGIRGTDYKLLLEQLATSGFGLYIGVHYGTIWVRNNAVFTDVYEGEYYYLESTEDPGVKLLAPPELFSQGEIPSSGIWTGAAEGGLESGGGTHEARRSPSFTPAQQPDPDPPIDPEIPMLGFNSFGEIVLLNEGFLPRFRYHAFAAGPLAITDSFNGVGFSPIEVLQLENGNLTAFPGLYPDSSGPVLALYEQGTSSLVNTGFDPDSGLRWGRWAGGEATATHGGGTENIDLSQQSLHWIVSRESLEPTVLPISGVADYRLVGNTDPTDNFGNVGFMDGSSHMQADFTNQTVATQIDVGINNQRWSAHDADGRFGEKGTFAGQFDSVQVTGGQCSQGCSGNGGYSGFFTGGNGSGPPPGAGMGYNMEQGGQSVSGTAAFGDPQEVASP